MKKAAWIVAVLLLAKLSWSEELLLNPQNLSLKAGPTEPTAGPKTTKPRGGVPTRPNPNPEHRPEA